MMKAAGICAVEFEWHGAMSRVNFDNIEVAMERTPCCYRVCVCLKLSPLRKALIGGT